MPISHPSPPMMLIGYDIQSIREFSRKPSVGQSLSVFSSGELEYCGSKKVASASLTGIFCAKEAFIKAVSSLQGMPVFGFPDIEVRHEPNGRPYLFLRQAISAYMSDHSLAVDLSISHTADTAGAMVIVSSLGGV